jgi:antitoxin component YwqK of YwqJK toxin-antitoxin module
MQNVFFGTFLIVSITVNAQYDTVIGSWIQGELEMTKYYSFQKPTVLVFEFHSFYYTPDGEKHPTEGKRYYHYSKGKANGLSFTVVNGQLVDSGNYKNGLKEGLFKTWQFPGGKIREEKRYKNGELDGLCKWWAWDGSLAYTGEFIKGKRCSNEICYFSNGNKGMERTLGNDSVKDTVFYWYFSGEPLMYITGNDTKYFKPFEENFGTGVVIKEYKHIVCPLYEHPEDTVPLKNPNGTILTLEGCYNNTYQVLLNIGAIYLRDSSGWSELIVKPHKEGGCVHPAFYKVWIRTECVSSYYIPWNQYLVGKELRYETVYDTSHEDGKTCQCLPMHCLEVINVVGDWLLVRANDDGSDECNNTSPCDEEGWVRWKDGEKILVEFRE